MTSLDSDCQVSLMLCESILHLLVEEGVISNEKVLEAINGVVELVRESHENDQCRSTSRSALQLVGLLETIAHTFAVKGADEVSPPRFPE